MTKVTIIFGENESSTPQYSIHSKQNKSSRTNDTILINIKKGLGPDKITNHISVSTFNIDDGQKY